MFLLPACGSTVSTEHISKINDLLESKIGESTSIETLDENTSTNRDQDEWSSIYSDPKKVVVWALDHLALVKVCEEGFTISEKNERYLCAGNVFFEFEKNDGSPLVIPQGLSATLNMNLDNPGGSMFRYTVTPDESYLLYFETQSNGDEALKALNLETQNVATLMSILSYDPNSCSGLDFFGWNPSGDKLGFVVRNESLDSDYPTDTKIFILSIEEGEIIQKNKYNLSVYTDCSANNGPFFTISWLDDASIQYYDNDLIPKEENYPTNEFFSAMSDAWETGNYWGDYVWIQHYNVQ